MTKHQQETMFPQQCFLQSQRRQTCCNLRVFGVVCSGLKTKITQELSVLGPLVLVRSVKFFSAAGFNQQTLAVSLRVDSAISEKDP